MGKETPEAPLQTALAKPIEKPTASYISPIKPAKELRAEIEAFIAYRNGLLNKDDIVTFRDKKGAVHAFVKKSGWVKTALAFGIENRIVGQARIPTGEDGHVAWSVTVEVSAPSGLKKQASQIATTKEVLARFAGDVRETTREKLEVSAYGLAETRAFGRAMANLTGTGEVSAEEIQ